jgi:hypothetical protein
MTISPGSLPTHGILPAMRSNPPIAAAVIPAIIKNFPMCCIPSAILYYRGCNSELFFCVNADANCIGRKNAFQLISFRHAVSKSSPADPLRAVKYPVYLHCSGQNAVFGYKGQVRRLPPVFLFWYLSISEYIHPQYFCRYKPSSLDKFVPSCQPGR